MLKKITPKQISWLIPAAYMLHLLDEYFSGKGFPEWFSILFNVSLSTEDFIVINSVGFITVLVIILLFSLDKIGYFFPVALGVLFFVNGIIHFVASLFTASLSPGTISGVLLYIPLGMLIFRKTLPLLTEQQRQLAIAAGIIIHIVVSFIAFNI